LAQAGLVVAGVRGMTQYSAQPLTRLYFLHVGSSSKGVMILQIVCEPPGERRRHRVPQSETLSVATMRKHNENEEQIGHE
jgi:hypothetical protein